MSTFKGLLSGGDPFDAFDLFGDDSPAPPPSEASDFRNSKRGYVFEAGERSWRVMRDDIGHQQKLVVPAEGRDDDQAFFAEMKDGTILISKLSKHGAYRAVGKPIAKKKVAS